MCILEPPIITCNSGRWSDNTPVCLLFAGMNKPGESEKPEEVTELVCQEADLQDGQ